LGPRGAGESAGGGSAAPGEAPDAPAAAGEAQGTAAGDYAVRATAAAGAVLALAATSGRLCEEARRRHGAWPTAAAALGRVLTAAALLALPLKDRGSITLRVRGDGPLGGILATARPSGAVRGYAVHPHVDLPPRPDGKLDVGGAVGRHGVLTVTRDLGLRQPYTGSAELVSGEIADDLTHYLAHSEQVPSSVALGVLIGEGGRVRAAGGLLIQRLPGAPTGVAEEIEGNILRMGGVSRLLDAGASPEDLLRQALGTSRPHVLARRRLRFACDCSLRRMRAALATLPAEELRAMREEDGGAELLCHFCGRRYHLGAEELAALEGQAQPRGGHGPAQG
jgi:molecular chaperone Hsp33